MFWTSAAPEKLLFRTWDSDDQVIVFQPFSGDTHSVDEFGMALLLAVERAPCTAAELAAQLGDFFDDVDAAGQLQHVDATLRHFRRVGLVISSLP